MAARKPDIQYITQFYVHGSEARVLELKPGRKKNKTVLPESAPQKKIRISIDPVAICGIVVAAVMLVLMLVGMIQYLGVCQENRAMKDLVVSLQNENTKLTQEYEAGYDLEDIRTKALAIGMIPKDQVQVVTIHPVVPEVEKEPSLWENICWYFNQLFA